MIIRLESRKRKDSEFSYFQARSNMRVAVGGRLIVFVLTFFSDLYYSFLSFYII